MIIEERYPHAVTGRFPDERRARNGIEALLEKTGLRPQQVKLIRPYDDHMSRKLEPESRGIYRTLLSAHVWMAISGFIAGIALAGLMIGTGPGWAANNPVFAIITFAWVGTLAGAMLGGLITLRPDRDSLTTAARRSSAKGDWTVVAHCESVDEKAAAADQLEETSRATRSSL